jgi:hypothetical protein
MGENYGGFEGKKKKQLNDLFKNCKSLGELGITENYRI